MARLTVTFTLEGELISDAVDGLERVHKALAHRHGAAFRRLDRRIERIVTGEVSIEAPGLRYLGDGRFIAIPPRQFLDILDEAGRLGVF
jgi:hypothetical protein